MTTKIVGKIAAQRAETDGRKVISTIMEQWSKSHPPQCIIPEPKLSERYKIALTDTKFVTWLDEDTPYRISPNDIRSHSPKVDKILKQCEASTRRSEKTYENVRKQVTAEVESVVSLFIFGSLTPEGFLEHLKTIEDKWISN